MAAAGPGQPELMSLASPHLVVHPRQVYDNYIHMYNTFIYTHYSILYNIIYM